jgi:HlyD family secretion protein
VNLSIKKLNKKLIAILICLFVGAAFFSFYLINRQLLVVQTTLVEKRELMSEIKTSGVLQCAQQQDFYARTSSAVKEIRKTEGAKVTLGEVILLLDNNNALRELGKAENALVILQNDYLQAVSDKVYLMNKRDEARKNQEWAEELFQAGEISWPEIEDIKNEILELENQIKAINLNTLESQVNKGRLAVQAAREDLAETVITSPFPGTLLQMAVKRGEPVAQGKFLFSIGKTDILEVVAFVSEHQVFKLKKGDLVEIYSDALTEKVYRGEIKQIAPRAEMVETADGPESKVKLKIAFREKAVEFKPGFTVNIRIPLEEKTEALLIPQMAIKEEDERCFVFVYEQGTVRKREVQLGLAAEGEQEVIVGLQAGETVIISHLEKLQDQMKVKVN